MMEVIILAGGFGTRLQSVVSDLPKPMAPVKDKPFVEYILNWMLQFPIKKIIFSVGYKHESISSYFGDSFNNIPIVYAIEKQPLGTGGAIAYALSYASSNDVVIINGDTYFPINLTELYQEHVQHKNLVTIALKEMTNFDRYGTVELDNNCITSFNEKKYSEKGLINAGIYAINVPYILNQKLPEVFSFEKEIFEKNTHNQILKGKIFEEYFIDIGIPEDYQMASQIL